MNSSYSSYLIIIIYLHTVTWFQVFLSNTNNCPVGWGCRIHWLHLCRCMNPHPTNECTGYDTKQSDGEVPVMPELLGNAEYPFIAISPRYTLVQSSNTWLGPIYGSNRTKLHTYAKLNSLKWNCFCILN